VPELPDVEVFRRRLARSGLHRRMGRVEVPDPTVLRTVSRQRLARTLHDRELVRTRRHGKHLLVAVDEVGWLVLHFGMTGSLVFRQAGEPGTEHPRLLLHFAGRRLVFDDPRKLGFVTLTDDDETYVAGQHLGPDALEVSPAALRELLTSRRGALKPALMDQALLAGIGNIYSDEILFQARVDPRRAASRLDDETLRRLHRQIGRVLRMAADRDADPERLPRTWLLPHREDGAPCPRGNGQIRRYRLSGRGAFYCPGCQAS
jgi:formamidopyrimidine-DNA glycosylase